jgi:hypothetical protein
MMRMVVLLAAIALGGCEGDPIYVYVDGEGGMGGGIGGMGGEGPGETGDVTSVSKIEAFLEGKTLTMAGADLCSHPNGFDANANLGQATQCYNSVAISVLAGRWTTRSVLGALEGAADVGDVGTCNTTVEGAPLEFASTAVLINNVSGNGECFDVTATYPGFGQEGRGRIAPDGQTVFFEFYFKDTAIGHRCADGPVGDISTVSVNDAPFGGDAVQVYRVQ